MPVGAYATRAVEIGRPRIGMRGPCHLAGELCQGFNYEIGASTYGTQGARGAGHAPQREIPPPAPAASLAGGGNGLMEARARHGGTAPPPGAGRASSPRRQACDLLIHQVRLLDLQVPID
jgi:hypothetical protein